MDKENNVMFLTMETSRSLITLMENYFREYDVSFSEAKLLITLHFHEPISQVEFAELMQIKPATLSTRLKRLEKLDMIQRVDDLEDSRKKLLMLTEKANNSLHKSREIFEQLSIELSQGISEEQVQQYREITEIIKNNIRRIEND